MRKLTRLTINATPALVLAGILAGSFPASLLYALTGATSRSFGSASRSVWVLAIRSCMR